MKTTNFFVIFALTASSFVYTSCDKEVVEENTAVNVPVPDFSIDIQTTVLAPESPDLQAFGLRSENLLNHFSGTAILDINDNNFKNLKNNQSLILLSTLKIGEINILISSITGTGNYSAENISISVPGFDSFIIEEKCPFDKIYTSPALSEFAAKIFVEFIKSGLITVSVDGYTDAEADGDITISLYFNDIEIKANLVTL